MLCNAIVTFFMVYSDGHKELQTVHTTVATSDKFRAGLDRVFNKNNKECEGACTVEDFKVQTVPEYNCSSTPDGL